MLTTAAGQVHHLHHTIAPAAMQLGAMHLHWTGREADVLMVTVLIAAVFVLRGLGKVLKVFR